MKKVGQFPYYDPKITEEDKKALIEDRKKHMTYRELAEKYGLTYQRVARICEKAGIKLDMRKYRWSKG